MHTLNSEGVLFLRGGSSRLHDASDLCDRSTTSGVMLNTCITLRTKTCLQLHIVHKWSGAIAIYWFIFHNCTVPLSPNEDTRQATERDLLFGASRADEWRDAGFRARLRWVKSSIGDPCPSAKRAPVQTWPPTPHSAVTSNWPTPLNTGQLTSTSQGLCITYLSSLDVEITKWKTKLFTLQVQNF